MTIRSDRSTFRELFDAADSTAIIDKRSESTVAPQALFLLNHPFTVEQAKALAKRVRQQRPTENRAGIEWLYPLLYGRPPRAEEITLGLSLLGTAGTSDEHWQAYCQVLLCANEFIFLD